MAPTTAADLINLQRDLHLSSNKCLHLAPGNPEPEISFFQQSCTPNTNQHLEDWRNRLRGELESQGHYHRDAVLRSVAKICEDLETRCKTIEEPLHREKERSNSLERRLSELNEQIVSMKSRMTDDELHLQGMEDERELMENERRVLVQDKDRLHEQLEELKANTVEERAKAEEILGEAREQHNSKELELQSTILRYEDTFDNLNKTLSKLEDSDAKKEQELRILSEQQVFLSDQLQETSLALLRERDQASKQSEEFHQLEIQLFKTKEALLEKEAELQNLKSKLENLEIAHHDFVQSAEKATRELEAKHASDSAAAANELEAKCHDLQLRLGDVQMADQQSRCALEKMHSELQVVQETVRSLERTIQELSELCSEQGDELEELRTLRRNVLASMGLGTQPSLAIRAASRPPSKRDSHVPRDVHKHWRRKSSIVAQDFARRERAGSQSLTDGATQADANTSFTSTGSHSSQGGSTPKRAKGPMTIKVPEMHSPYAQKGAVTSKPGLKRLSRRKRSILRQISPNRRHTSDGFTPMEQEGKDGEHEDFFASECDASLPDVELVDLDEDDDFLAGTPMTPEPYRSGND